MFSPLRRTNLASKAQGQRRPTYRPSVEALEDRCVPTTIALNFNSLPSAQGWSYVSGYPPNSPSETAVYSVDGTTLTQNTMGIHSNFGNYAIDNAVDPTKPFTITVRACVLDSEQTQPGGDATAFGVAVFTGTEAFGFSLNKTTMRAPAGTNSLRDFDSMHFHDFRIEATPGVNVSIYVDNGLIISEVPPRNNAPSQLELGNASSFENGKAEITSFSFTQGLPDLVATKLEWNTEQSGVNFSYKVAGANLTQDTTAALYWARGTTFDTMIDPDHPLYDTKIEHPIGDYGPFYVPNSVLGTPPQDATNLLLAVDPPTPGHPHGLIEESNEDNNVFPLGLPSIVLDSLKTTDSRSVQVDYDVMGAAIPQPIDIGIYRSSTEAYSHDPQNNRPIASYTISGDQLTVGHHPINVSVSGGLPPEFGSLHYVVAAADPQGKFPEWVKDNSRAHFHTYVIGAVSVGFDPAAWGQDHVPDDWVQSMADSLGAAGYGRDMVVPFGWASGRLSPFAIGDAGHALADKVRQKVKSLDLAPNDVVDVHLIGHSRGSVVISLAMQELLQETDIPQLQDGYFKMTLLDPHPANLIYGLNADINFSDLNAGITVLVGYTVAEGILQDPPVKVPARVNEVEQFWQQNHWQDCPFGVETYLNLRGLDPRSIVYEDRTFPVVFNYKDLTGMPGYGHSEVHDYYQHIIDPHVPPGPPPGGGGSIRGSTLLVFESGPPVAVEAGPVVPPGNSATSRPLIPALTAGNSWGQSVSSAQHVASVDRHFASVGLEKVAFRWSRFPDKGPVSDIFGGDAELLV